MSPSLRKSAGLLIIRKLQRGPRLVCEALNRDLVGVATLLRCRQFQSHRQRGVILHFVDGRRIHGPRDRNEGTNVRM